MASYNYFSINAEYPTGAILNYSAVRNKLPDGWLICDGTSYSRDNYNKLFTVIGTTYGSDGSTTFKVPDFTDSFACGNPNSLANNLGAKHGNNSVTLNVTNLPKHKHELGSNLPGWGWYPVSSLNSVSHSHTFPTNEVLMDELYGGKGYWNSYVTGYSDITSNSNIADTTHTHAYTTATDGNSVPTPLNMRPAYLAMYYIIKF